MTWLYCLLVAVAIAGLPYIGYRHGLEVQQGRVAEADLTALQAKITGMVEEISHRQEKADESQQAIQQLDAEMDRFGSQLRRLAGGCVVTPDRLRVLQDAANATNALGYSSTLPGAAKPKR